MKTSVLLLVLECIELTVLALPMANQKSEDVRNEGSTTTTTIPSIVSEKLASLDSLFQKDVMADLKYVDSVLDRLEHERDQLLELQKNENNDSEASGLRGYLLTMTEKLLNKTQEQINNLQDQKSKLEASIAPPSGSSTLPRLPSSGLPLGSSKNPKSPTDESPKSNNSISSKILCQFFVFGTLFGVVCSISTCTCFLHPRRPGSSSANSRRRRHRRAVADLNPSRIPQPFDYSKPCKISFDERGLCYASPLKDDEIPPLPSYEAALTMPTSPVPPGVKSDKSNSVSTSSTSSSSSSHSSDPTVQTTVTSQSSIFTTQVDIEYNNVPGSSRSGSTSSSVNPSSSNDVSRL